MTDARCEPPEMWEADCGVCGTSYQWNDKGEPLSVGHFCPNCRSNGLSAPGVLHFSRVPPPEPVLTPAEVAALRAERDAAVAENHRLKTGNKLLADTVRSWGWESRMQESNGELIVRALWEQYGALAALCAEVEKLRAALKPFADAAPKFRDCGDVIEVADIAHDATFTVGDLRRAATIANAVEVPE